MEVKLVKIQTEVTLQKIREIGIILSKGTNY